MKSRHRIEADEWVKDGANILTPENVAFLKREFEEKPPIVEHRFYRGSSSPSRLIFENFEQFSEYLSEKAFAGDSIWIWDFETLCRDDNPAIHGKCPADNGSVPRKGAY